MAHNNEEDDNTTPSSRSPPPSALPTSRDRIFELNDKNGKLLGRAKVKIIAAGGVITKILYVSPKRWLSNKDKWYTFLHETEDADSDLVWKIDKSEGGDENMTKVKPFYMTANFERKLINMDLLAAQREGLLPSSECKNLIERVNSNDMGRAGRKVRAVVAGVGVVSAASIIAANEILNHSLGKIMNKYFGSTTTVTVDHDVHHWNNETKWNNVTKYVNETKWNNITKYVSDIDLEKALIGNCSDVFNITEIKNVNNETKRAWLARDGLADILNGDPALWKEIQAVNKNITKKDFYVDSWADVASVIRNAGYNSGFNAGKVAGDAAVKSILSGLLNETKPLMPEYTAADWEPYETPTIDNIVTIEGFHEKAPYINNAFADHYIADYFSHTGLTKKAAYNDTNFQAKDQKGIEYKSFAVQYEKNLTASKILNMTGNARIAAIGCDPANGIFGLEYIAEKYVDSKTNQSWLGGTYNVNLTKEIIQEIANNDTYGNTSLGVALSYLRGNGADRAEIYIAKDGLFVQGYTNNTPVTVNVPRVGLNWGGAKDNNQKNFELFKKFKA